LEIIILIIIIIIIVIMGLIRITRHHTYKVTCFLEIITIIINIRRRWVDDIKMDFQEVGFGYIDWIGLAQDRDSWRTLLSAVMKLRVP